jgi:hypothetical protein
MVDRDSLLVALLRPDTAVPLECPSATQWHELIRGCSPALHPWLAYCVERHFAEGAPANVAALLAQARRGAAIGHLRRQALLRRLLPALDAGGIAALVLKGGAVAYLSYPEPSLRSMSDLDFWVAPADLDRTVVIAREVGLEYSGRYASRLPAARDARVETTRVLEYPGTGLFVEVHGVLGSLKAMPPAWVERVWSRRERRTLGDVEGWVMHPEDMLTHLVIHCGRYDRFRAGLRPLLDIALWLRREGARIDWPILISQWERERMAIWALLPIQLSHELLGAPVPAEVLQRISLIPGFGALRAAAIEQMRGATLDLPPFVVAAVANSKPRAAAAWVFSRAFSWYWKGPAGSRRSIDQTIRDASSRLRHDCQYKAGPVLRSLLRGHYWGREWHRRKEVAAGAQRLVELVDQLETGCDRPLTSSAPTKSRAQ